MSKVFAVFDEPISCDYCPCFDGEYWHCGYANRYLDEEKEHPSLKQKWCPLREVPNKKENWTFNSYDDGRVDGWNDCVDEILGE